MSVEPDALVDSSGEWYDTDRVTGAFECGVGTLLVDAALGLIEGRRFILERSSRYGRWLKLGSSCRGYLEEECM